MLSREEEPEKHVVHGALRTTGFSRGLGLLQLFVKAFVFLGLFQLAVLGQGLGEIKMSLFVPRVQLDDPFKNRNRQVIALAAGDEEP